MRTLPERLFQDSFDWRRLNLKSLPRGWYKGLSKCQVRRILKCEQLADAGIFRIQPAKHEKGYLRVSLPTRHPYARSRTNLLHRHVMERLIGRRLKSHEHVHHAKGAAPDTADVRKLELWEADEHGRHHCNGREKARLLYPLWKPRDERGRFTKMPTADVGLAVAPVDEVPF